MRVKPAMRQSAAPRCRARAPAATCAPPDQSGLSLGNVPTLPRVQVGAAGAMDLVCKLLIMVAGMRMTACTLGN